MRYVQRGGYTPAEQQRRERLRLEAAGRSARGDTINKIAHAPGCAARAAAGSASPRWRATRPGDRPRLSCQLRAYRPPHGRGQGVHLAGPNRDLIIAAITTCQPRSLVLQ